MPANQSAKSEKTRTNSRAKRAFLALVALVLLFGGGALYVQQQLQPPAGDGKAVAVEIPMGATALDVGVQLAEKGLIQNPTLFKWYLAYQGQSSMLKAGKYYLTQGMTIDEVSRILVNGDAKFGTIQFTVPEGMTIDQIGDMLSEEKLVTKEAFLQEVATGQFEQAFLKDIPKKEGIKHRLEGYLSPDTYEIFKDANAHQIIETMLKQTDSVFTPEWREQMKKRGLTMHETLTLASLVEREARVAKERPTIAGVIHNRLKLNPPMKLQIDATIQYALGENKDVLLFKDLEIESPYNTYKYEGMPPGPIATPGRDAIKAVLFPEQHEYLFYVTKNDGSGEHHFAKTFDEHNKNIAKSNQP